VYEPALEECECPSPECEQREICFDELIERLVGVKQMQEMLEQDEEERARAAKKAKQV